MYPNYPLQRTAVILFTFCCLFISSTATVTAQKGNPCNASSQYLYWTGEENQDFFNEKNWRITNEKPNPPGKAAVGTVCLPGSNSFTYAICRGQHEPSKDKYPKAGSIDPGLPIDYNMLVESGNITANGSIVFACAQKGLTLSATQLSVTGGSLTQGVLSLLSESTVHFRSGAFSSALILNFLDTASWVYMHQQNPDELTAKTANIHIKNTAGILDQNFRIQQYYQHGAVIRPYASSFTVLKIFSAAQQQGNTGEIKEDIIYKGNTIPGGMDNATASFVLKRGYMASFANNGNGTGKGKVYIASETDMVIHHVDLALQGNISFIRVVPWNWVTKKGTGGSYPQLDAGWYYNWGLGSTSQPNYEYVPMAWGSGGASPASINQMIAKKKTTHALGFNESDNCSGESGQFNNLCQPAVAVAYYENLMSMGLRLGTPAPRENGPTTWLLEFARIAKEKNVRFDFVAVHWYDWGSNPASSPNASAQQIFNRFKTYLDNVYNIYKLPIWITEFNANPNRTNSIQEDFLKLALPYLDTLRYVERYAYFQPNPANAQNPVETANYLNTDGSLTNIGELYKNHVSTPSIPQATLECRNNLDLSLPVVAVQGNTIAFEAECGKFLGTKWTIPAAENASNGLYIRGDENLPGEAAISKQVHFEFELTGAGTYRVWMNTASMGTGSIRIAVDGQTLENITPLTSSVFTWFQIPRFYDLGEGKHRLTLEFPNSNILVDQIAITNDPPDFSSLKKESGYCSPAIFKWGLTTTDFTGFLEAEAATKGTYWQTKTTPNAKGGAYAESEAGISAVEVPEGTNKLLSFQLNIAVADEYDIWAKIQALNPGAGLWISVDDEPFRKWNNLTNTTFEWYWKKFHYSYGNQERNFTYFLEAGDHTVRIAIASGGVQVDRLAVVTKGKIPENTDPNVLLLSAKLEFEAEDAVILGAASIVNCASSSNSKLVNPFNLNSNGVRFNQIVAESAGAYKLKVSYISAAIRSFRLIVNGTILGRQQVAVSGAWCFNGGAPAIYETIVILKRGNNTIDITPFNGDAPFLDKIKLERADAKGLSLEAETAELVGTSAIVSCATSSNSALVNMLAATGNAIRFNNILAAEGGTYLMDVYYISGVDRNARLSVNGTAFTSQNFLTSGAWCFNGGAPKVKTIEITLIQGINTVEFRPTGTDAPFIDRIVFRQATQQTNNTSEPLAFTIKETATEDHAVKGFILYPNPLYANTPVILVVPELFNRQPVSVRVADMWGRTTYASEKLQPVNKQIKLQQGFNRGIYTVTMWNGTIALTRKMIVL